MIHVLYLLIIIFLLFPSPILAFQTRTAETTVSASVGEYRFTLFGYGSPYALVTIEGMGIHDQTRATGKGYFEFKNRFSPFSPREACITSLDQFGRTSAPTCLPPFPTRYNITIGPILLPATLSFDKTDYFVGEKVILTGQTIPNTDVDLSVFDNNRRAFFDFFSVQAVGFPKYEVKSDEQGNFSIILPSSASSTYRMFARTQYEKSVSPNSLTLKLSVLPMWMMIIKYFQFIWEIIRPRLTEIIIVMELASIAYYILHRYLHHPHKIRALTLRPHYELAKFTEH